MNKMSKARMAVRYLAAASALFFSALCLSVSVSAAELVGKPVPVGKPAAVVTSGMSASSLATTSGGSSAGTSTAAQPVEPPLEPVPPVAPLPPPADLNADDNPFKNPFNHSGEDDPFDHGRWDSPELLIPIVAMSLLFGGPVLLVIVLAFFYYRAKARRQQNINANIDKLLAAGRDIPVELLMGDDAPLIKTGQANGTAQVTYPGAEEMMYKGVRNIGLGTGWLLFLTVMFGFKIGSFGFIFIGLGISQVVIWLLSGSRRKAVPGFTLNSERVED